MQIVCIFGDCGACRGGEFGNVNLNDIDEHGRTFLVRIPTTNTKVPRSFTIGAEFYDLGKKYMELRPNNATTVHFFLTYYNGK